MLNIVIGQKQIKAHEIPFHSYEDGQIMSAAEDAEDAEVLEPFYNAGGSAKWCIHFWKQSSSY